MKIFTKYALDINCLVQNSCLQRELDFLELKLHVKLEFHELELQNSSRLLNSLHTMINCKIFRQIVLYVHFCHKNIAKPYMLF